MPEKNSFVHNGMLKESNVAFIFRDNRRFPSKFFHQYLQLLEVRGRVVCVEGDIAALVTMSLWIIVCKCFVFFLSLTAF